MVRKFLFFIPKKDRKQNFISTKVYYVIGTYLVLSLFRKVRTPIMTPRNMLDIQWHFDYIRITVL